MPADSNDLAQYVRTHERELKPFRSKRIAANPFVTISRQAGARGHELAEVILAALKRETAEPALQGWQLFDREICIKLVEDRKLHASLGNLLSESYRTAIEDFIFTAVSGQPSQSTITYEIVKAVRTLAFVGKAIIVGRAAACYTPDITGGLHLRLVASERTRTSHLAKRENISEAQAAKRARELDASRSKIAKVYFQRDIEDPLLYDAVWNVNRVPLPEIASFVVSWIKQEALKLV